MFGSRGKPSQASPIVPSPTLDTNVGGQDIALQAISALQQRVPYIMSGHGKNATAATKAAMKLTAAAREVLQVTARLTTNLHHLTPDSPAYRGQGYSRITSEEEMKAHHERLERVASERWVDFGKKLFNLSQVAEQSALAIVPVVKSHISLQGCTPKDVESMAKTGTEDDTFRSSLRDIRDTAILVPGYFPLDVGKPTEKHDEVEPPQESESELEKAVHAFHPQTKICWLEENVFREIEEIEGDTPDAFRPYLFEALPRNRDSQPHTSSQSRADEKYLIPGEGPSKLRNEIKEKEVHGLPGEDYRWDSACAKDDDHDEWQAICEATGFAPMYPPRDENIQWISFDPASSSGNHAEVRPVSECRDRAIPAKSIEEDYDTLVYSASESDDGVISEDENIFGSPWDNESQAGSNKTSGGGIPISENPLPLNPSYDAESQYTGHSKDQAVLGELEILMKPANPDAREQGLEAKAHLDDFKRPMEDHKCQQGETYQPQIQPQEETSQGEIYGQARTPWRPMSLHRQNFSREQAHQPGNFLYNSPSTDSNSLGKGRKTEPALLNPDGSVNDASGAPVYSAKGKSRPYKAEPDLSSNGNRLCTPRNYLGSSRLNSDWWRPGEKPQQSVASTRTGETSTIADTTRNSDAFADVQKDIRHSARAPAEQRPQQFKESVHPSETSPLAETTGTLNSPTSTQQGTDSLQNSSNNPKEEVSGGSKHTKAACSPENPQKSASLITPGKQSPGASTKEFPNPIAALNRARAYVQSLSVYQIELPYSNFDFGTAAEKWEKAAADNVCRGDFSIVDLHRAFDEYCSIPRELRMSNLPFLDSDLLEHIKRFAHHRLQDVIAARNQAPDATSTPAKQEASMDTKSNKPAHGEKEQQGASTPKAATTFKLPEPALPPPPKLSPPKALSEIKLLRPAPPVLSTPATSDPLPHDNSKDPIPELALDKLKKMFKTSEDVERALRQVRTGRCAFRILESLRYIKNPPPNPDRMGKIWDMFNTGTKMAMKLGVGKMPPAGSSRWNKYDPLEFEFDDLRERRLMEVVAKWKMEEEKGKMRN